MGAAGRVLFTAATHEQSSAPPARSPTLGNPREPEEDALFQFSSHILCWDFYELVGCSMSPLPDE